MAERINEPPGCAVDWLENPILTQGRITTTKMGREKIEQAGIEMGPRKPSELAQARLRSEIARLRAKGVC